MTQAIEEKKTQIERPPFEQWAISAEGAFTQIAPKAVWLREIAFALQILRTNAQTFEKCVPGSIRDAVINIGLTGATLNPAMQQAFLIPRNIRNKGLCCCLDFSYRGLVKIATDSGSVLDIDATCVYEGDEFYYEMGLNPVLKHIPCNERASEKLTHVYAVATLYNGIKKFIVLTREDVEKARKSSQAPDSPAWKGWYEEMARKTAVKRLYKLLPQTDRLSEAIAVVNEHEGLSLDGSKSQEKAKEVLGRFTDAGSSKGRTSDLDSDNEGSIPSPATNHPEGSVEDFLERIERIKNIHDASAWKKKHQSEIDKLLADDKTVVMDAYFNRVNGLKG